MESRAPDIQFASYGEAAEARALEAAISEQGYRVHRLRAGPAASEPLGGEQPLILHVGRCPAALALDYADRLGAPVHLLIADAPELLGSPELASFTGRLLVAPYDAATLGRQIDEVVRQARDEFRRVDLIGLNIVGDSPQARHLVRNIVRLARYDAPVLIEGETGTGKELVARSIHYGGARLDHPFVPVNCGALNDELLLAELFGYEKGAFTDAKRAHAGLVAQAAGGTLFLDEIDSLSAKGQAALLRFLQDKEYRPLGSDRVHRSDVRVVCATNCDLAALVAGHGFREDLYYRLRVLDLRVPPLRERRGDVAQLARHFLEKFSLQYREADKRIHPETLAWMERYAWPGNVRELENYLHRLYVLTVGPLICVPNEKGVALAEAPAPASPAADPTGDSFQRAKLRAIDEFERSYLSRLMQETAGNVSLAARRAGKERRTLGRLLKKHRIDRNRYTDASAPPFAR